MLPVTHIERYFPNHRIEKDIGIAEYNFCSQKLGYEERSFTSASNIAVLIATAIGYASFKMQHPTQVFKIGLLISVVLLSLMTILYFQNLQKSMVFSARKLIVIRRILGVSFGDNTLVLPNWRIEGADQPFAIKMFPGYLHYHAFPIYIIVLASSWSIYLLFGAIFDKATIYIPSLNHIITKDVATIICIAAWVIVSVSIYRLGLRDTHETILQLIARLSAAIFRVRIFNKFEYILYRAKLDTAEADRLKFDFREFERFAVLLEDRQFYRHFGVNLRGVFRAIRDYLRRGRRSGGSTITQQLARTLFIPAGQNVFARKIVEIFLALWLESCLSKNDILRMYLVSARYDYNINGFHRAVVHFFGAKSENVGPAMAFVIIERLSNIKKMFHGNKIAESLRLMIRKNEINLDLAIEIARLYEYLVRSQKLSIPPGGKTPRDLHYELHHSEQFAMANKGCKGG